MVAFCSMRSTPVPGLVDLHDDVPDLVDQLGGQPEARLVEEEIARRGHQGSPHRQHLLLATGEVAGGEPATVLEHREQVEDPAEVVAHARACGVGAGAQVVLDAELDEHPSALEHLPDAVPHDALGRGPVQRLVVEGDRALGDLAVVDVEQPGESAQQGGLAGAVGAEHRDDLVVGDLEAHPAQREHHVVVDDFEVARGQHAPPGGRSSVVATHRRRPSHHGGRCRAGCHCPDVQTGRDASVARSQRLDEGPGRMGV